MAVKAGVPGREFSNEIAALRHFDGKGTVRLLDADGDVGVMLMERLHPGTPLRTVEDDSSATSIFANVVRRMRKAMPEQHDFPTVADWAAGFERARSQISKGTTSFPESAIGRGEGVMTELIDSMSSPVLLHGDLHHWNILAANREPWLAIDPQGVIGEPAYEVGAWLRNPFPQILTAPDPKRLLLRRIDQLVDELGFDRTRIVGWAYSQAVLAAVWSFEEGANDWKGWLDWSREISPLL